MQTCVMAMESGCIRTIKAREPAQEIRVCELMWHHHFHIF